MDTETREGLDALREQEGPETEAFVLRLLLHSAQERASIEHSLRVGVERILAETREELEEAYERLDRISERLGGLLK